MINVNLSGLLYIKSIRMSDNKEILQEEDASQLKFPKEFEDAETLLISEVHMLMQNRY
jgi:hypothetical protein